MNNRGIYFDNAATTPISDKILDKAKDLFLSFGNPSGRHVASKRIRDEIEHARYNVAKLINAKSENIYFLSGATEANNTVIKGFQEKNDDRRFHVVTSEIEHPSVLSPIKYLVNRKKIVASFLSGKQINNISFFASIMYVNNESGTLHPIEELANSANDMNIFLHSDVTQAVGKVDVDVTKWNIDAVTFSGHKIHVPKGIGVLYLKDSSAINPVLHGGGQEKGLRAGTENVFGILALGIISNELNGKRERLKTHFSSCRGLLLDLLDQVHINYSLNFDNTVSHILSVRFVGIKAELLLAILDNKFNTQISIGSACSSNKDEKFLSHVLTGFGLDESSIRETVRISFGQDTTKDDIIEFVKQIKSIMKSLNIK